MAAENGPGRGGHHGAGEELTLPVESDAESLAVEGLALQALALLVCCAIAARMCGVSARTWRRLNSRGLVPRALHVGKRRLWSVEELKAWTAAGCPTREAWESRHRDEVHP